MTASLLIATYNWPQALQLGLDSILRQTVMPTEVLIADDGSGPETRDVIARFAAVCPVPVKHIWHEDQGFRLASIRNKAIAVSSCDYIIQIDGDVILERHFVEDHMSFARRGYYVGGSRGMLTEKLTDRLLEGKAIPLSPFRRGVQQWNNVLWVPFLPALLASIDPKRCRGCNMAYWHDDVLAINGYNEAMTGWGYEDNELACRLQNIGITKRTLKFGGILYHLFHKLASRSNIDNNHTILKACQQARTTRCEQGLDQYI